MNTLPSGRPMHGRDEDAVSRAAALYGRAALAMNFFFAAKTGRFCADCLALHGEFEPDGPVASNKLVRGVFPGCCQSGVDVDFRLPGRSSVLPEGLAAFIEQERFHYEVPGVSDYDVLDEKTGRIHTGRGCKWLGEAGCVLGRWKSPICLTYLCEPARCALEKEYHGMETFSEEDFLGSFGVFEAIARAAGGGREEYAEARRAVLELLSRVRVLVRSE